MVVTPPKHSGTIILLVHRLAACLGTAAHNSRHPRRTGYGFWFDSKRKKHMCDCPTARERRERKRGGKESLCFVRRRNVEGAGTKSLVRFPERARRRASIGERS